MGSLTIALIAGGWGIAALLAASRADADEQASIAPEKERVRERRFEPRTEEKSARDVAPPAASAPKG